MSSFIESKLPKFYVLSTPIKYTLASLVPDINNKVNKFIEM